MSLRNPQNKTSWLHLSSHDRLFSCLTMATSTIFSLPHTCMEVSQARVVLLVKPEIRHGLAKGLASWEF